MRKLSVSYIFWKTVVRLLMLLMTLAVSIPLYYILGTGDFEEETKMRVLGVVVFAAYLLIDWFFAVRSDLSRIKGATYIAGEVIAYSLVTLVAAGVTAGIYQGITPGGFSYFAFPFFAHTGAMYLSGNVILGAVLQIPAFAAGLTLVYFAKKKKDPALTGAHGAKKTAQTPETDAEPAPAAEEEKEE